MQVSRRYCRSCWAAFSALPDCHSARLPGSLGTVEAVSALACEHGVPAAAREYRGMASSGSSARRWVHRRVHLTLSCLRLFRGLLPVLFAGLLLTPDAFRQRLEVLVALVTLQVLASGLDLLCANQHLATAVWGLFLIVVMGLRWIAGQLPLFFGGPDTGVMWRSRNSEWGGPDGIMQSCGPCGGRRP